MSPVVFETLLSGINNPVDVVNDVCADIDEPTLAMLRRCGEYGRVIGYVCECHLAGEPMSVARAIAYTGAILKVQSEDPLMLTEQHYDELAEIVLATQEPQKAA